MIESKDFSMSVREIIIVGIDVIVSHQIALADISLPGCNVDSRTHVGLLVGIITVKEG